MKKAAALFFILLLCLRLGGCSSRKSPPPIAATTLPVAEFTERLCQGTGLTVSRLVTEPVSCLHDYSLNVDQVRLAEAAETVVISGAGLEDFLDGILAEDKLIDASAGIPLLEGDPAHSHEEHDHHDHGEGDPHIWLSPKNAAAMVENICAGLSARYPEYGEIFQKNLQPLLEELDALQRYGDDSLAALSTREIITFHDGFAYFADAFGLTILEAVEEESGSEASAKDLIRLIRLTEDHHLPGIFTEKNGSTSAAGIISRETGAAVFPLDMAMSGNSYFDAMYHNIDTIKEALA